MNMEYDYTIAGDNYMLEAYYDIDTLNEDDFDELVGTKSLKEYKSKLKEKDLNVNNWKKFFFLLYFYW